VFTNTPLVPLKVVTLLNLLVGALKTAKTTGLQLTHGTTHGVTTVPSRFSRATAASTTKSTLVLLSDLVKLIMLANILYSIAPFDSTNLSTKYPSP